VRPAIALAGVAIGLGSMAAAARLPFVPGWRAARIAMLAAGFAAAAVFILFIARWRWNRAPERRRWTTVTGALLGLSLLCACALGLVWATFGITNLGGEELTQTVQSPDGRQTIFVYSLSEIPDGVVGSRVALREGWLPLERTLLEAPGAVREVRREGGKVLFVFARSGEARYDFATGRLDWPDRRDSRR
jgi:hypothetical protein